jgi:integral membrane protein (TIGR01906 family)
MKSLHKILSWVIAFTLPVVIVLSIVRLVLNPWYVEFEYRTPGFPADPYGFILQDRLNYSKIAIDYLVNDAGIEYLGDLRFPPGQKTPEPSCQFMDDCTRFYNDRELQHMLDVKNVVSGAMIVLQVGFALLVVLAIWAWRGRWVDEYLHGLERGGVMVLILLGIIILLVLLAFNYLFVIFHEIFFQTGTWMFLYSDTLIRLFPERFWQDTFLVVGGLSIALGLLFFFLTRKVRRNRAVST